MSKTDTIVLERKRARRDRKKAGLRGTTSISNHLKASSDTRSRRNGGYGSAEKHYKS
jgi:hypothetical protein